MHRKIKPDDTIITDQKTETGNLAVSVFYCNDLTFALCPSDIASHHNKFLY